MLLHKNQLQLCVTFSMPRNPANFPEILPMNCSIHIKTVVYYGIFQFLTKYEWYFLDVESTSTYLKLLWLCSHMIDICIQTSELNSNLGLYKYSTNIRTRMRDSFSCHWFNFRHEFIQSQPPQLNTNVTAQYFKNEMFKVWYGRYKV